MKGKPLLPSMKQKKRYVVFEVLSKGSLSYDAIKQDVKSSLLSFLGELGYGKAGIMFIDDKFNKEKNYCLIKVNNGFVDELKAGLALVKSIGQNEVIVKSVITSGTIKKLDQYFR